MTDYTVSTAVSISKAYASITTSCPYVTATLLGSDSDYADNLTACTSCSDLDGYKITVISSIYSTAFTFGSGASTAVQSIDNLGGCIATATTASAVCMTQSVFSFGTCGITAGDTSTNAAANCLALVQNTGTTPGTDCAATDSDGTSAGTTAASVCVWTANVWQMGGGVVSWSNTTDFAAAKTTAGSALISATALTEASNYL